MFKLVKCSSYNTRDVSRALKQVVNLKNYISKKDKVLLKPNLLFPANPDKNITTHPSIVKAVVKELNNIGAEVIIADTPGGALNEKVLEKLYKECGMNIKGAVLNYDVSSYDMKNPEGFLKKYKLLSVLKKVDKIINLPKIKTHMLCTVSCATKNLFGLIPGGDKVSYHARFKDVNDFSKMLVELAEIIKPTLNIVDAVLGMEGQGPSNGKTKKLGLIIAGDNCFEVDYNISKIIGIDYTTIPYLNVALAKKLFNKNSISFSDYRTMFEKPSSSFLRKVWNFAPAFIKNIISNYWLEIPVMNNKCIKCGDCVRACPVKAINIKDKAVVDYNKCIRCYCCHELCRYKAVDLKKKIF
ncbi:MAG: DUF362 domain-containing protein [Nanoarchaeota archaeon]|nr:DUF362 domain-containing protein [Nanoarchaeota archaeon]